MANPAILMGDATTELVVFILLALACLGVGWLFVRRRGERTRAALDSLPAFRQILDEIKRAAESGKVVHIALGYGGLHSEDAAATVAALQVVEGVADAAAAYNAQPIVTVGDPTLFPIVQDVVYRVYDRRGISTRYRPDRVRFVAPDPVAYAAGAAHVVAAEGVTANVMVGAFGAEVSLITDAGSRQDMPQLGAAVSPAALGALYPATTQLAIGEELFAGGAQMTGARGRLAGVMAQQILRVLVALLVLALAMAGVPTG